MVLQSSVWLSDQSYFPGTGFHFVSSKRKSKQSLVVAYVRGRPGRWMSSCEAHRIGLSPAVAY